MGLQISRALPDQNNWKDLRLPDIRDIDPKLLISSVSELPSASCLIQPGSRLPEALDLIMV